MLQRPRTQAPGHATRNTAGGWRSASPSPGRDWFAFDRSDRWGFAALLGLADPSSAQRVVTIVLGLLWLGLVLEGVRLALRMMRAVAVDDPLTPPPCVA
ncbi:MAG: hypothetical protein ABIU87_13665 [Ornithinibacter sp.]